MSWARLDDGFHDHPKIVGLTLAEVGLWTLCFTWANRHLGAAELPAGFIPAAQVRRFGGTRTQIGHLVDAGLWDVADGGWLFHDFSAYLPASRDPETSSSVVEARREAGRKGAAKRWHPHGKLLSANDAEPLPPSRPVPQEGGARPSKRPEPWCSRHPGGTDSPCGACGVARRAADSWQAPTPTPPSVSELRARGVIA